MMNSPAWRVKDESTSMERLDGETILINFDTGQYFSFQASAADVLWLVQTGVAREFWASLLTEAFSGLTWDEACTSDVEDFLATLGDAGVLATCDEPTGLPQPLPSDYIRDSWTAPTVSANDELADLLVIDPIHETSEDGWPQAR